LKSADSKELFCELTIGFKRRGKRRSLVNTTKLILNAAALMTLAVPALFAQQTGTNSGTTNTSNPPTIQQRKENQQDRIANGIDSGQLTAGETAKLENKEQGVNREVAGMRQANGGKLTAGDKAVVNKQQNKLSKQIYNKKHNASKQ
jgi:hypothetical protein